MERGDNSSILRPALKRSMSVGLIGIKNTAEQDEEAVELGIAAEQAEASMARYVWKVLGDMPAVVCL